jgi:hypothetical protein
MVMSIQKFVFGSKSGYFYLKLKLKFQFRNLYLSSDKYYLNHKFWYLNFLKTDFESEISYLNSENW